MAKRLCVTQALEALKLLDHADPIRGGQSDEDDRIAYRQANLLMLVTHPGGSVGNYLTHSRFLTSTRLSLLTKVFMHSGAVVKIYLPDKHGIPEEHSATVIRCNYACNSLHETLLTFNERLNLREYVDIPAHYVNQDWPAVEPEQLVGRIVVYCDGEADFRLVQHYLRNTRVRVSRVESIGQALDHVRSQRCDAFLCDDKVQNSEDREVRQSLREAGYMESFVTLRSAESGNLAFSDDMQDIHTLSKPLDESGVMNLLAEILGVETENDEDLLYSSLPPDEHHADLVGWYVEHVKSLNFNLQKATTDHQIDQIKHILTTLRDTASSYGFNPVSQAALDLMEEIRGAAEVLNCAEKIQDFIRLTRRMRAFK